MCTSRTTQSSRTICRWSTCWMSRTLNMSCLELASRSELEVVRKPSGFLAMRKSHNLPPSFQVSFYAIQVESCFQTYDCSTIFIFIAVSISWRTVISNVLTYNCRNNRAQHSPPSGGFQGRSRGSVPLCSEERGGYQPHCIQAGSTEKRSCSHASCYVYWLWVLYQSSVHKPAWSDLLV